VRIVALAAILALTGGPGALRQQAVATGGTLRVCADPNNLPFSNDKEEGFENALARLIAGEFGQRLDYVWWPQRRGFVRNTLNAGTCDLIVGVPASFDAVLTTRPYYRSTYVFVSLQRRDLDLRSFDDPRLRTLRVGVQMIGDDFANSPPAHALSARGIVRNIVGYSVLGDYSQPNPPARIVDAVLRREVDVAVVWGPLAGYFARRAPEPLALQPVSPQVDASLPFVFDISMGVRRRDRALKEKLDAFLERRRADVNGILERFGIPRVDPGRSPS
jgi:mxaJ protein